MTTMDIMRIIMWIISILLIPCFVALFNRVRSLELKMETRISHQDAARMVKESSDKMDDRFDRIESLIIEDFKRRG